MICSLCDVHMPTPNNFHYVNLVAMMRMNEYVPLFCSEKCMLKWLSIRTGTSLSSLSIDYGKYKQAHDTGSIAQYLKDRNMI